MTDEEPREEPESDGKVNWVFWEKDPVLNALDLKLAETLEDGKRFEEERRQRKGSKLK